MYHHIRDIRPGDDQMVRNLCTPQTLFTEQLDYLKTTEFQTITFLDLREHYKLGAPLPKNPIIITFDDGYSDNWDAFLKLHKRNMLGVFFIVTTTIGKTDHLSTTQIQNMATFGMEIGSHAHNHVDLRHIKKEYVKIEILRSQKILQKLTGQPVISFCYPNGRYNHWVIKHLKEANFWYGRTASPGKNNIQNKDFTLKVIRMGEFTTVKELAKALAPYKNK